VSGPERTFVVGVNKHLDPDLHHEGMANPYRGGTPDQWYSGRGADLWVEFKWVVLPKRSDTLISIVASTPKKKPSMSVLQQNWNFDRRAEGRNCWVIIGSNLGGLVCKDDTWAQSWRTDEFIASLKSRKEIAAMISTFCRE
jgi:hypothetical protein